MGIRWWRFPIATKELPCSDVGLPHREHDDGVCSPQPAKVDRSAKRYPSPIMCPRIGKDGGTSHHEMGFGSQTHPARSSNTSAKP